MKKVFSKIAMCITLMGSVICLNSCTEKEMMINNEVLDAKTSISSTRQGTEINISLEIAEYLDAEISRLYFDGFMPEKAIVAEQDLSELARKVYRDIHNYNFTYINHSWFPSTMNRKYIARAMEMGYWIDSIGSNGGTFNKALENAFNGANNIDECKGLYYGAIDWKIYEDNDYFAYKVYSDVLFSAFCTWITIHYTDDTPSLNNAYRIAKGNITDFWAEIPVEIQAEAAGAMLGAMEDGVVGAVSQGIMSAVVAHTYNNNNQ